MRISIIHIWIALVSSTVALAQPSNQVSTESYLTAATKAQEASNPYEAISLYQEAYESSAEASTIVGLVQAYEQIRDYNQVITWSERYLDAKEGKSDLGLLLTYANALKSMGQYSKALKYYKKMDRYKLDEPTRRRINKARQGAVMASSAEPQLGVSVVNAGPSINKSSSEYSPFLTKGGDLYYAALTNPTGVAVASSQRYSAKLFVASANAGAMGEPQAMDQSINDADYFQSNVALSDDGQQMIFARQRLSGESQIVSSDLYRSYKKNGSWMEPKQISPTDGALYKSPSLGQYQGQSGVYFVSDRDDSYGGYDIYFAGLTQDGMMGEPKNLGSDINTSDDEESPFYAEGQLYFSSKGHPGFGGYDVFYSMLGQKEISNMGRPYNSPADDLYFMMADDYSGVLVSNRGEGEVVSLQGPTCCNDIYMVNRAKIELAINAEDSESAGPIAGAAVVVTDSRGRAISAGEMGYYLLDADEKYTVEVSADGFEAASTTVSTADMWTSRRIEENVALKPIVLPPPPAEPEVITVAEPIVLEEILFDYNDDKILPAAEGDLNYLLTLMRKYEDMKIKISSHTDARGVDSYNQRLSQRRSDSVRKWLIAQGVDRNRLTATGSGSTRPLKVYARLAEKHDFLHVGDVLDAAYIAKLNAAQQELAHQLNRRSEFEITAGPKVILKKVK